MRHTNALDAARAALVVIDMQEAFRPPLAEFSEVAARVARAARGAGLLGVPVVVTEQYPRGLGRTVEEVRDALPPDFAPIEKTAFSACGAPAFVDHLKAMDVTQILLCGIEAHVCVNQTAHDLLARGYQVHLLTDAVASRSSADKRTGVEKMRESGALACSTEMALFELMRDSRHEQFKAVQKIIK